MLTVHGLPLQLGKHNGMLIENTRRAIQRAAGQPVVVEVKNNQVRFLVEQKPGHVSLGEFWAGKARGRYSN